VEATIPVSHQETVHKVYNPPQFVTGCGHSIGKQRDHNEDALFTLSTTLLSDEEALPFGLYLVADGMGGHQHGEMASGVAVRAMSNYVINQLYSPLFSLSPAIQEQTLHEIMETGIQHAHRAILQQAPGGGSTLTGALALGDQLTIAHVGDSRAYLIQDDGRLDLLTRDHSLVKRLVELGQITTDEAAVHPQRNVLYRALGQGEPIDAEITTAPLPLSGHLLICSDGLWGLVPEGEIVRIVTTSPSPAEACQLLVEAANQAGGPDNISAILVRVSG
jgi:protein phosphatase